MTQQFDQKGFKNAINTMIQLPVSQWRSFARGMFEEKNKGNIYNRTEQEAMQIMSQKSPQLSQFFNTINNQFGIKF